MVRRRRKSCHFDSSSEELSNIFSDSRITERAVDVPNETGHKHNLDNFHSLIEPPPDYEVRITWHYSDITKLSIFNVSGLANSRKQ